MTVQLTKKELERVLERELHQIPPGVYELRYVKISVLVNNNTSILWVYRGKESDYLIIPGVFCSCKDFILRTIINKTSRYCKHQLGVYVAMSKNKYLSIDANLEEVFAILKEILDRGFSPTLRRKISAIR